MRLRKNQLEDNMLVVKDTALINASYNLDLVEQRLILLAIVEARESGKGINANDPLQVHAESYINQFNVARQTAYEALKNASESLFMRQFSYQSMSNGVLKKHRSRWLSEIIYIDQQAIVEMIFAPAIIPLITRLEKHFTSYELEQVALLQSKYAVRLYELIIAWRSIGKTPIFEISDFRKKLGVDDNEYKTMSNFKAYVFDRAIKQINDNTDIVVTYEQHKNGREIAGFSFTLKPKNKQKQLRKEKVDQNTLDVFFNLTDAQINFFGNKLAHMPEFAHLAHGNEDYEALASRIKDMLKDEKKQKLFISQMRNLGFNPKI